MRRRRWRCRVAGDQRDQERRSSTVLPSCTAPGYVTKYSGLVQHFDSEDQARGLDGHRQQRQRRSLGVQRPGQPRQPDRRQRQLRDHRQRLPRFRRDPEHGSHLAVGGPVGRSCAGGGAEQLLQVLLQLARVDRYTVDGGTTWNRVWQATTEDQQGPLELALPLAANQSNVRVRFHYSGEFAYYWEVDDVYIGHKSCGTVPGGLVAGFVRDDNTEQPVNGASVKRADHPADAAVTMATPNDPGIPDGFYELFSTAAGSHPFVASKSNYANSRATVAVSSNGVTRKDFRLQAGQLAVSTTRHLADGHAPASPRAASLTLRNTGTRPVQVDLGEKPGTFQIGGQPARASYAGVTGAATHRVAGHYSPLRAYARHGVRAQAERGPVRRSVAGRDRLPDRDLGQLGVVQRRQGVLGRRHRRRRRLRGLDVQLRPEHDELDEARRHGRRA